MSKPKKKQKQRRKASLQEADETVALAFSVLETEGLGFGEKVTRLGRSASLDAYEFILDLDGTKFLIRVTEVKP